MPPKLALLLTTIFVVMAFRSDRKRDIGETEGLFWPWLWYMIVGSRPLGIWMDIWGLPVPGGGEEGEGSLVDRYFFATLTIIGLRILSKRRHFKWGTTLANNPAMTILVVFMAASIMWSTYPFISFKRYVKVIGSVVMAMVVLTTGRPLDGILTVIRRVLYVHLPMSIICTRYFRDIGVSFEWGGRVETWQGISTSKNTLGQIALLGVLYFSWQVIRNWRQCRWKNLHVIYLLMGLYLIKGSSGAISMTSLSVCGFALAIFWRIQSLRFRPGAIRGFMSLIFGTTVGLVLFVVAHSILHFSAESLLGSLITMLGRDITLTDRTYIWSDVYAAASGNPLLGVGYGGFWIGRMANIPWNAYMTWVLGQAHSGYVDTYLQLGLIGAFLLAGVLFSGVPAIFKALKEDFDYGCLRFTLFMTIIYINITESTFLRGDHNMWFLFMMVIWSVPDHRPTTLDYAEEELEVIVEGDPENESEQVRREALA